MGRSNVLSWWRRRRLTRQVDKATASTVSPIQRSSPLFSGPGVVLLPFDPVQAALAHPFVEQLCAFLEGPLRLAGPVTSLRWAPESTLPPLEIPADPSPASFREWLEYHRSHRCDWCLLLSPAPSPLEEACLKWLGTGARIASGEACLSDAANVKLRTDPEQVLDAHLRRMVRIVLPNFPVAAAEAAATTGPIVLEVPSFLADQGRKTRSFCDLVTRATTSQPILLAHTEPLPALLAEVVRSLGPRLALVHLATARDVKELARRARMVVGNRSPTTALAALAGCKVKVWGKAEDFSDFPSRNLRVVSGKIVGQELDEVV